MDKYFSMRLENSIYKKLANDLPAFISKGLIYAKESDTIEIGDSFEIWQLKSTAVFKDKPYDHAKPLNRYYHLLYKNEKPFAYIASKRRGNPYICEINLSDIANGLDEALSLFGRSEKDAIKIILFPNWRTVALWNSKNGQVAVASTALREKIRIHTKSDGMDIIEILRKTKMISGRIIK